MSLRTFFGRENINLLNILANSLVSRSLGLDKDFILKCPQIKFHEKIEFITKKYLLLIKHLILLIPAAPQESHVKINKKLIYYDSDYGIAMLQAMVVDFDHFLIKHLSHLKQPTIIDIGAHLGFFSMTAARFLHEPKIYACEPSSIAFELLKKNVRGIRSIIPVNLGFSNSKSQAKLFYLPNLLSLSSLFPERFGWSETYFWEKVKLDTLDSFVRKKRLKMIDILKIDAEGAEEKILRGAHQTLAQTRYLILECSLDGIGGTTFSSILHNLYGLRHNFQLVNIQTPFLKRSDRIATVNMLFENLNLL